MNEKKDSMALIVFSNEIIGMVKRIMQGITVNPETLALDVINKVGPNGNFVPEEHTVKILRMWSHYE